MPTSALLRPVVSQGAFSSQVGSSSLLLEACFHLYHPILSSELQRLFIVTVKYCECGSLRPDPALWRRHQSFSAGWDCIRISDILILSSLSLNLPLSKTASHLPQILIAPAAAQRRGDFCLLLTISPLSTCCLLQL